MESFEFMWAYACGKTVGYLGVSLAIQVTTVLLGFGSYWLGWPVPPFAFWLGSSCVFLVTVAVVLRVLVVNLDQRI